MQPSLMPLVGHQVHQASIPAFIVLELLPEPLLQVIPAQHSKKINAYCCQIRDGLSNIPSIVAKGDDVEENPVGTHEN